MVGVGGLEPPTSWSQTKRANRLRYTPVQGYRMPTVLFIVAWQAMSVKHAEHLADSGACRQRKGTETALRSYGVRQQLWKRDGVILLSKHF